MKVLDFWVDMRGQNGVYGADAKNPLVYRLQMVSAWAKNPIHVGYSKEFLRCLVFDKKLQKRPFFQGAFLSVYCLLVGITAMP